MRLGCLRLGVDAEPSSTVDTFGLIGDVLGERFSAAIEGLREDESLTSDIATDESRVNTRSDLEGKKSHNFVGNRIWF